MALKSKIQNAIDVKLMDVKNVSSIMIDYVKPKLYYFLHSDAEVIHRVDETENAFDHFSYKAYIFACNPSEAFLMYVNYCESFKINVNLGLEKFEENLTIVNENLKHYTVPRIERLEIINSVTDNIDNSSYITTYNYYSTKNIKKLLYNCQPLEDFNQNDNVILDASNVYREFTNRTCDFQYDYEQNPVYYADDEFIRYGDEDDDEFPIVTYQINQNLNLDFLRTAFVDELDTM